MSRLVPALAFAVSMILPGWVAAQDNPVVVELFTSQGCSSCPPADEMLGEMASRDDIIALALHVDYWDYIGWKDVFGSPANTRRQHAYATAAHARTVYTPQFVIAGEDHVVGARAMDVMDQIRDHAGQDSGVRVVLRRDGARFVIEAQSPRAFASPVVIQLVRYVPSQTVDIRRGENAGHQYTYHNIVSNWDVVGEWDGRAPLRLQVQATGTAPAVVIVQQPANGPILAAARLR